MKIRSLIPIFVLITGGIFLPVYADPYDQPKTYDTDLDCQNLPSRIQNAERILSMLKKKLERCRLISAVMNAEAAEDYDMVEESLSPTTPYPKSTYDASH